MFMRKAFILFAELSSEVDPCEGMTASSDWVIDWRRISGGSVWNLQPPPCPTAAETSPPLRGTERPASIV
jgi:hypothetical protein